MKVLIIAPVPLDGHNIDCGGGVSFSYMAMIDMLRVKGHEVRWLSPWHNLEPMYLKMYPGFRDIRFSWKNRRKIRKEMQWADRVLTPDSCASYLILQLAREQRTPVILCNHTNCFKLVAAALRKQRYGRVRSFLAKMFVFPIGVLKLRLMSRASSMFLVTTKSNQSFLQRLGVKVDGIFDNITIKTRVFREPDSLSEINKIRRDLLRDTGCQSIIMYAGRVANEKRIPLLIKARPPRSLLLIVGDGPAAPEITALSEAEGRVKFINRMVSQQQLRKLYKACDLAVSASDFETLGMSVYEAWLCGKQSVVEDCGGFRDQIRNERYGSLVSFDRACEARQAIEDLLENPRPLAFKPALPLESSIEEYLQTAKPLPKLDVFSRGILSLIDYVVLIFGSPKNPEHRGRGKAGRSMTVLRRAPKVASN